MGSPRNSAIAIVGGGIGGLTAALELYRRRVPVQVYEQAPAFAEIGAGVQLAPNAVRLLERLGVGEHLHRRAIRPASALEFRRWRDGRVLGSQGTADSHELRYGAQYLVIHRAHLLEALLSGLPPEVLHGDRRCVGVELDDGGATIHFADGKVARADVVVAADGLWSQVRDSLLPGHGPRFSGHAAFRGLLQLSETPLARAATTVGIWLGPGQHFVHYPVAGQRLNVVGLVKMPSWEEGVASHASSPEDFSARYAGWHRDVRDTIERLEEVGLWGLFSGEPLPRWVLGRVALLGDAAHGMLPFAAQGACQAIEDAAALAACIAQRGAGELVESALARYERLRKPRATQVQALAQENATVFNLPDGPEQERRDEQLAVDAKRASDWLYGYDAALDAPAGRRADRSRRQDRSGPAQETSHG